MFHIPGLPELTLVYLQLRSKGHGAETADLADYQATLDPVTEVVAAGGFARGA